MGILAEINDIVDIATKVDKLWKEINTSRGCVCEVHNWTNEILRRTSADCSHGGFKEPPDLEIPPRKVEIFSAESSAGSIATGVEGIVTYNSNAAEFKIRFDNPWAGGNSGSINVNGEGSDAYKVASVIGNGNQSKNKYDILPKSEHVFSGGLSHAMWTHGHSVQLETPEMLEKLWRAGMWAQLAFKPKSKNWVHYAIPTTVIVPQNTRLRAGSVMIRYRVLGDVKITNVHVYDGETVIATHDNLDLNSSSWSWPRFDISGYPEVRWGVGVSLNIDTIGEKKEHAIEIASVGCDFLRGAFI